MTAITRSRRRTLGLLFIGTLMGMTLGWPLVGAIVGSTWIGTTSDTVGPDEAAALRILHGQSHLFHVERPPAELLATTCLDRLPNRSGFNSVGDVDIAGLLRWTARWQDDGSARQTAEQRLRDLPRAMLGALDYCIGGSLLGPLCRLYTQKQIVSALHVAQPSLVKKRAEHEANSQQLACHVLAGPQ